MRIRSKFILAIILSGCVSIPGPALSETCDLKGLQSNVSQLSDASRSLKAELVALRQAVLELADALSRVRAGLNNEVASRLSAALRELSDEVSIADLVAIPLDNLVTMLFGNTGPDPRLQRLLRVLQRLIDDKEMQLAAVSIDMKRVSGDLQECERKQKDAILGDRLSDDGIIVPQPKNPFAFEPSLSLVSGDGGTREERASP